MVRHPDRTARALERRGANSNAIDETNCIAGFLIVIDIIDII